MVVKSPSSVGAMLRKVKKGELRGRLPKGPGLSLLLQKAVQENLEEGVLDKRQRGEKVQSRGW